MTKLIITAYVSSEHARERAEYEGKFLQIALRGREYLLFASFELHRYHNQILTRFLDDNGIAHRWFNEERLEFDCAELTIFGGGRFHIDTDARTLQLCDNSQVYGRFDERGLKEKIAAAEHPWSGFAVDIA